MCSTSWTGPTQGNTGKSKFRASQTQATCAQLVTLCAKGEQLHTSVTLHSEGRCQHCAWDTGRTACNVPHPECRRRWGPAFRTAGTGTPEPGQSALHRMANLLTGQARHGMRCLQGQCVNCPGQSPGPRLFVSHAALASKAAKSLNCLVPCAPNMTWRVGSWITQQRCTHTQTDTDEKGQTNAHAERVTGD